MIERELGAGGMATVYLAQDVKHDRKVALKVLRPELGAVLGAERFLAEIRITARLDHPHILTLIDSGASDGLLYYVLPFVRGESLRQKLTREGPLGVAEALAITRQVAGALDFAHREGVVHRDIKPENILLQEGEAMLADFGIALAVTEAGGNRLTETGLSLGTPQYMSPEQATGERRLDARSDVYSLAAVLYEMLAGEPPVTGPSAQAMIAKLMTEHPTRLRIVRHAVPEGVDAAVARALAKTPADRFASAGEFVRALDTATPVSAGGTATRRRTAVLIALGGAAALVAVGAYLMPRSAAPPPRTATQLTSTGGSYQPAIAPDGQFLAYVTETCGGSPRRCRHALVVQDLASASRPTAVVDDRDAIFMPRWSADGSRLYFTQFRDAAVSVATVPRLGGSVEQLGPYVTYAVHPSRDVAVATRYTYSTDSLSTVAVVRPSTATVVDSVTVPGALAFDARWSPDGRWLVLTTFATPTPRIVVISPELRIVDQVAEPRFGRNLPLVRWTAGSDGLYLLAAGTGGRGDLVRRRFDGRRGRFAGDGDTVLANLRIPFVADFDVSPDGSLLVYTSGSATSELWTLERDRPRGPWRTRRIRTSTAGLSSADITDDGERIAFAVAEPAGDSVRERVYAAPFSGDEPRPIGPPLRGATVTWPHGLRDTLRVSYRGERDSTREALVAVGGGGLLAVPVGAIIGLSDGRRLVADQSHFPRVELELQDADGRPVRRELWPDSLGVLAAPPIPPARGDDIALVAVRVRNGRAEYHAYRYDPIRGVIAPIRSLGPLTDWNGEVDRHTDGRLGLREVPGFLGGTANMRLRMIALATGHAEVEELPLPFVSFRATHDHRRGVGIVVSRQSDVWLVRNFDRSR